ncbi:AAA family ATPase [Helicobacter suis]|uniref:AAA family ATPase n=1 Tax=Helicobacter suis TaxID=104628 RepID=UPI0013CF5010|nr:AAA family ATPase [Helicobacter suis]
MSEDQGIDTDLMIRAQVIGYFYPFDFFRIATKREQPEKGIKHEPGIGVGEWIYFYYLELYEYKEKHYIKGALLDTTLMEQLIKQSGIDMTILKKLVENLKLIITPSNATLLAQITGKSQGIKTKGEPRKKVMFPDNIYIITKKYGYGRKYLIRVNGEVREETCKTEGIFAEPVFSDKANYVNDYIKQTILTKIEEGERFKESQKNAKYDSSHYDTLKAKLQQIIKATNTETLLQTEKSTEESTDFQDQNQDRDQEQVEKSTSPQDKYSPKAIKKYLDRFVFGQENPKERISLALSDHYKRINGQSNLPKANVLCIGPSGSGKTLTIEKAAEYLDIPYCIFNAASLSPSGYTGASVSEIFFNLYTNANCDIEKAQKGVVALDEIDKLGQGGGDSLQFRQSVQSELLKMVEKGEISFEYGAGLKKETISLKTGHILFICLGCFEKISHSNIKVRQTHPIGFLSDKLPPDSKPPQFSDVISDDDLVKCGMKPEFLRRFSYQVVFNPVDKNMLAKLFERHVVPFQEEFKQNGSDLEFRSDAKTLLIKQALEKGTGMSALDRRLREVLAKPRFNIEKYKGFMCVITCNTLNTGDVEVIPL